MLKLKFLKPGDLIYLNGGNNKFYIQQLRDPKLNKKYLSFVIHRNIFSLSTICKNETVFTVLNDKKLCSLSYKDKIKIFKHACLVNNNIVYIPESFLKMYFSKIKGIK